VRNGAWFVRRVWDSGLPLDLALFRRCTNSLVHLLPSSFISSEIRKQVNTRFDHAVYGLQPSHDVLANPAVTSDDLPRCILSGSVQVRPGIARLTSSGVHFTDGTYLDDIDAVISGTGWSKCVTVAIISIYYQYIINQSINRCSFRSVIRVAYLYEVLFVKPGVGLRLSEHLNQPSRPTQLGHPLWVGAVSTSDGLGHRLGRNGEICVTVGPVWNLSHSHAWKIWRIGY